MITVEPINKEVFFKNFNLPILKYELLLGSSIKKFPKNLKTLIISSKIIGKRAKNFEKNTIVIKLLIKTSLLK